jgi:hypothetical protein
MTTMDAGMAARFMALTLSHIGQEYPHKLDHVLNADEDAQTPVQLHPIFHGSFDWHSCVHGWWQLLRLCRLYPDADGAAQVCARADAMLTPDKVAVEVAYLARPNAGGFERPYGWAWTLALHGEAVRHAGPWGAALEPLARAFAARFMGHLPVLTYPIRVGTHYNTAFALTLALDWADVHDVALAALIRARALAWFGEDRAVQGWEPGGDEFLSPALCEAVLMRRVLDAAGFAAWLGGFLPEMADARPPALFAPAHVSDRSDGKIAHLDGLNLSRAWCWRDLARALPAGLAAAAEATAARHIAASLPHIADDYAGTHWLATFAVLALQPPALTRAARD